MTSETSPPPAKLLPHALLATALYGTLTLVYLRPIWRVFGSSLAPSIGDPLFSVYILKWVTHQIHAGFPNLWDANFFYPTRGTLALSDHMLGPAFEIAWIKNPVAGYNLLFFSSFVLSGVATWWVLRRSGLSGPAALLGGAAFAFSPFRLSHLNHLLILIMQWIPLTLWSWDRLLAERTARRGAVFLLFYGLQVTAGCYLAYMIHVPMLAILASRWVAIGRRRLVAPASLRVLVPVAALALAALVAVFLPYVQLARRTHMAHDDYEIGRGGAALASYVSPAPRNLYSVLRPAAMPEGEELARWQRPFVRPENSLFPGFLPTLLAAYGLWDIRRRYRAPAASAVTGWRRLTLWALAVAALATFALGDLYTLKLADDLPPLDRWDAPVAWTFLGVALLAILGLWAALRHRWTGGPLLRWSDMDPWHRGLLLAGLLSFALSFPVVYFPLMRVLPGLQGMRVPARFAAFVSLTVAFLAAWGLDRLVERWRAARHLRHPPGRWRLAAGAAAVAAAPRATAAAAAVTLATLLALELAPRPVPWLEVLSEDEFPDVYSWIRGRSDIRALVEVPLRPQATEATYMYHSTLHWKPIANGRSSFLPDSYKELASKVRLLPDGDGFELLERMGVSHLVVHGDQLVRSGEDDAVTEARGLVMIRAWERRFLGRRVELVYPGDPDRVYRLLPLSAASPPVVHTTRIRGIKFRDFGSPPL